MRRSERNPDNVIDLEFMYAAASGSWLVRIIKIYKKTPKLLMYRVIDPKAGNPGKGQLSKKKIQFQRSINTTIYQPSCSPHCSCLFAVLLIMVIVEVIGVIILREQGTELHSARTVLSVPPLPPPPSSNDGPNHSQ
jgi:hypothetical protein